jgi:signal transduction histidine kinase
VTRRIALAILLSACAMLLMGGAVAYVAVYDTLLEELDDALVERAAGVLLATGAGNRAIDAPVPPGDRYVVRSGEGYTIARTPAERRTPDRPDIIARTFADVDGARVRTMTLRWATPASAEPFVVVYSTPATRFERTMHRLAVALGIVTALGVAVTAVVAARVSSAATRPLRETACTIAQIDERRLDRRLDPAALPRELAPVAVCLNDLLGRLERAFARQRQFNIDASHELRSPVAALRTTVEVALQRPKDAAALTATLQKCLKSTRMLSRLADVLTEHLRGEGAARQAELRPVDVARLVEECADVLEPVAASRDVALVRRLPTSATIVSDEDRVRSVVMNLLSNAIEYNRPGGRVEVVCNAEAADVLEIVVRDTGVGIAAEHLGRVTEPFYRADAARYHGAGDGHLGLGLYLVDSHVRALGGACAIASELGVGTTVTVKLPGRQVASAHPAAAEPITEAARGFHVDLTKPC